MSISGTIEAFNSLRDASGGVYSTSDLAVILARSHPSRLNEGIGVLIREGVLLRVRRGLYVDRLNGYRADLLGLRWVAPSCLSMESALDRHRLCQTGITVFTYVTPRLIARREHATRTIEGHRFIYRHLARHLFFGFTSLDGLLIADAEKAVLDFLYFTYKKHRSVLAPSDIDFTQLNPERYRRYLGAYRQRGFVDFALDFLRSGA